MKLHQSTRPYYKNYMNILEELKEHGYFLVYSSRRRTIQFLPNKIYKHFETWLHRKGNLESEIEPKSIIIYISYLGNEYSIYIDKTYYLPEYLFEKVKNQETIMKVKKIINDLNVSVANLSIEYKRSELLFINGKININTDFSITLKSLITKDSKVIFEGKSLEAFDEEKFFDNLNLNFKDSSFFKNYFEDYVFNNESTDNIITSLNGYSNIKKILNY